MFCSQCVAEGQGAPRGVRLKHNDNSYGKMMCRYKEEYDISFPFAFLEKVTRVPYTYRSKYELNVPEELNR